jgi:N-methylhydantoinase B
MIRPGLTEIIANALAAAAWEMCAALIRTAFSPNVKERADCSTALCDRDGRTLALAAHAPAHLGSTLRLVPAIMKRFPELAEGDMFIANDPYIVGVTHLNDCTICAPVFFEGHAIGFAVAVAHHSDVGGRVPGSESGDSTSIFQEGLRLPPMRLIEAGRKRDDVWEMILLNSRTPHFTDGDLHAQVAANLRGAARLVQLYRRHGVATMQAAIEEMILATRKRLSHRIETVLTGGCYAAEDWMDDDGVGGGPVRLAVEITVAGGRIHCDFTGCAPQIPSGKNIPYTHVMATVYYCVKAMLDPDLPINEGLYGVIDVTAPAGSVVNPTSPSGVSSRNAGAMILADVLLDALGQAAGDRAVASTGAFQGIILSGHDPRKNRFFVDYENFAGGEGGGARGDGADVMQMHMTNTANLPIEVMETEFPVRVERYEMIPDSGGAGEHRGGLGVIRDLRLTAPQMLANRSSRQIFPAVGRHGGMAGTPGRYVLNPGPGETVLPGTCSELALAEGDLLRVMTPGGGGYGPPERRDPTLVARDLRDGKISVEAARTVYTKT